MGHEIVEAVASPAIWPEPDYLNPILTFGSSVIGSVAWPLLVIAIILLFRVPIVKLIGRIKTAEAAGAKFEFSDEVQDLAANAKKIEPADPEVARENDPRLQSLLLQAATSPTGAIVEAWKDVELAANTLVDKVMKGMPRQVSVKWEDQTRRKPTTLYTHRLLRHYDLLPKAEMNTYEELRVLRNKVAHEKDLEVTPLAAAQYVKVADQLVDVITQYAGEFNF